jgi:hypothetical protein
MFRDYCLILVYIAGFIQREGKKEKDNYLMEKEDRKNMIANHMMIYQYLKIL